MSLAHRVSGFNRRRKWRLFLEAVRPTESHSILDVGFSDHEYSPNDNYIEKHHRYPQRITALGPDVPDEFRRRYPLVRAVRYGGGIFPFKDFAFDVCWSNAVLEHVGSRNDQIKFLSEVRRVARLCCVTTPNRLFPIEVHTRTPLLHLLPKPLFEAYLRLVGKGWATGAYMNLLSRKELEDCLHAAGWTDYRIHPNRLFGFVLDFLVIGR